jgi:carbon-monoxide dehydrogenase medium subunit
MKSAPFEYVRPKTVAEASALLAQDGVTTAAIAGGQSLVPMLNLRAAQIDLLVDLSRLEELKAVSETPGTLQIGALTTHAAIEDGKIPDRFGGLMRRVAGTISYRAVRNHGTVGGSVALADPAADWPGCLIALGATVRIAGRSGERQQPVADFVQGLYSTSLAAGEIVLGFDVPRPGAPLCWGFAKVARKSGAFANSIAFVVAPGNKSGPVSVVLAAAGPRPIVLTGAARHLASRADSEDALRAAIAGDLKTQLPDADAYEQRLHTSTVVRAARDMRAQS